MTATAGCSFDPYLVRRGAREPQRLRTAGETEPNGCLASEPNGTEEYLCRVQSAPQVLTIIH